MKKRKTKEVNERKKNKKAKINIPDKLASDFMIKDYNIVNSYRAQLPCGRKPDTWYCTMKHVVTDKEFSVVIKGPVINACKHFSDQLFADKMKKMFGLKGVGMKVVGDYLICKDWGHGGPYDTIEHRGVQVVDKTKSGVPMLRTWINDHPDSLGHYYSLVSILMFRYIFGVTDTHLNNILYIERMDTCISLDEETLFYYKRKEKDFPDCLFSKVPKKEVYEKLKKFLKNSGKRMITILIQWNKLITKKLFKPVLKMYGYEDKYMQVKRTLLNLIARIKKFQ